MKSIHLEMTDQEIVWLKCALLVIEEYFCINDT